MTTADLRTEIMQMIEQEEDTNLLEAIRTLLRRVQYASADDDLTDQEVAELEERYQEIVSGKVKPLSAEEFFQKLKGDGAEGV